MNVLIVYAHPEPRSLNGSLKDFAVRHLQAAGHAVQVSDLYAMNWKAPLDACDNLDRDPEARFDPSLDSKRAYAAGRQSIDIAAEQEKLRWADTVILQFPLWWFSMPAILKGWFERVYAYGFAYGVGEHSDAHWGDRYGEGSLARQARHAGGHHRRLGVALQPRAASTARSTTCCSRSTTACCITPASTCCRRSWSTAPAGWMASATDRSNRSSASAWTRSRPPLPSPSAGRMAAITRFPH